MNGFVEDASLKYAKVNRVFVGKVESLRGEKHPSYEIIANDSEPDLVLVDTIRHSGEEDISRAFYSAHKPTSLHFCPSAVNAAIVTCGGLCPGLNNVIRDIVHSLHNLYHVNEVWGVTGGWHGFHDVNYKPMLLTNQVVEDVHHSGGSFLKTSRGGLDVDATVQFLRTKNIHQLYILGGDGTHRAAYKIHEACQNRELNVSIVGIPKTIDCDIDYLDRTFGFNTAVETAQAAIRTGLTEAKCTLPNGIAVIKLMGRSAGFLAAFSALGSGDVDAVLVPEVPIVLDGPDGILPFLRERVKQKQFAVVVVAEGAGEELLAASTETEAGSGNKKLPPIAEYIRDQIIEYFEKSDGEQVRMKYIDPSYLVRSVPANASDSLYCTQLAMQAVHGAMSGYTGFSVGLVNNQVVYIPIPQLVATSPRAMDPHGTIWERVLAMTGQPNAAVVPEKKSNESSITNDQSFPTLPEPSVH